MFAKSGLTLALESLLRRKTLLVLNYHRVGNPADTPYDPGTFGPTAEEFDWQLGYLRSHFDCITLEEALAMAAGQITLRPSLLLTFDDGYLDNYQVAYPLLRSHGLQAVFFLPTDFIGTQRLPWWDVIAYILKHSRHQIIKVQHPKPAEFRIADGDVSSTIFQVLTHCINNATTDYAPLINDLETACGCQRPDQSAARCFMNWDEAREMQSGGGMAFGSHTHSHEILSGLSAERQTLELSRSRAILEHELGRTIDVLSYPVGLPYTFNTDTLAAVERTGYRAAFSFYGGANNGHRVNRFDIRREHPHAGTSDLFRLQTILAAAGKRLAA
jgi:peptidoglycan/xylan/chitin deacetylase (PgdA/CDA1 family)